MKNWFAIGVLVVIVGLSGCAGRKVNSTAAAPGPSDKDKGETVPVIPGVVLAVQAVSSWVSIKQSVPFTVTLTNNGTSVITLPNPCGDAFDLKVKKNGQEIDDWIDQFYGSPPDCPPNRYGGIKVGPGESRAETLNIRFSSPGSFSVYAITRDRSWQSADVVVDVR